MPENLMCPGQRIMTKEGKDNFHRIFKKKKKHKDCIKDKDAISGKTKTNRSPS